MKSVNSEEKIVRKCGINISDMKRDGTNGQCFPF